MATPLSSLSHGTTLPETTNQSHSGYPQQYHDGQYQSRPTLSAYQGKEVVTSTIHNHQQVPGYDHHQRGADNGAPEKTIFGLRKISFWLVVLAGILLVATIGAGAAAGVIASQKNDGGSNSSDGSSSPSTSSSASVTPPTTTSTQLSGTEFTAIPLPEEVTSRGTSKPRCPDSDLEETPINGTDLIFKHYCGLDYIENDLGRLPMSTMQDCIALCAAQNIRPQGLLPCVGVVWNYSGKQGSDLSYCWLKTKKGDPSFKEEVETAWVQDFWD